MHIYLSNYTAYKYDFCFVLFVAIFLDCTVFFILQLLWINYMKAFTVMCLFDIKLVVGTCFLNKYSWLYLFLRKRILEVNSK